MPERFTPEQLKKRRSDLAKRLLAEGRTPGKPSGRRGFARKYNSDAERVAANRAHARAYQTRRTQYDKDIAPDFMRQHYHLGVPKADIAVPCPDCGTPFTYQDVSDGTTMHQCYDGARKLIIQIDGVFTVPVIVATPKPTKTVAVAAEPNPTKAKRRKKP